MLPTCTTRFQFNRRGEVQPTREDDSAAARTIKELGLNHRELVDLRKAAIREYVHPKNTQLKLEQARRLRERLQRQMEALDQGQNVKLPAFCFALVPALEREVRKLQGILTSRTKAAR